jgi:DNA-binding response OmpR family regulator
VFTGAFLGAGGDGVAGKGDYRGDKVGNPEALDTTQGLPQRNAATPAPGPRSEKILVVEDTTDVRFLLARLFSGAGYQPVLASNAQEGLRAFFSTQPALALLDIRLPGMSGLELCSRLREVSDVPIIMFTGIEDTSLKLEAFSRGADDYVLKTPTTMEELLARVRAALARAGGYPRSAAPGPDIYSDEVLEIDFTRCVVNVRGVPVSLTPIEFQLLGTLVQRAGQPVRPGQLLRIVWGEEYNTADLVKWHIRRLRRKIEEEADSPRLVVTRRGYGYVYLRPMPEFARDARRTASPIVPPGAGTAA